MFMNQKTAQAAPLTIPKSTSKTIKKDKSIFSGIFDKVVGEGRELSKYWAVVRQIEALEPAMKQLTDEELKAKTQEFRSKLKGVATKDLEKKLQSMIPETFAVVREAAVRAIGMKLFPVQLLGGLVLNDGRIAEMKTGEGKTFVAVTTVYLNSLPEQNQVHLVTVNDYLARVGASWMGKVYDYLGLSVGVIQNQASFRFELGANSSEKDKKMRGAGMLETLEDGEADKNTVLDVENLVPIDRKDAYWDKTHNRPVDVVYGVNSEFGFDYLRDNMAQTPDDVNQKAGHIVAIVDEVDSILIDEARTPLIISAQDSEPSDNYRLFAKVVDKLQSDLDYTVDEKRKTTILTPEGVAKVEKELGLNNLYESSENVTMIHHLQQAMQAKGLFVRDKEYVVQGGEIVIVDENTGRMMVGRRYNQGLHQAIEAKEGIEIKSENKTVASITFQNYFRLYSKLAGMTGTAATESEELFKIYKLLVVSIPTNKPSARKDFVDYIFKNELGKFHAVVREIKAIHSTGQPILVGTTSIERNDLLSSLLKKEGLKFEVLNAKNHEQEARIIANAGEKGAITIATNIAGRGVDIKLGGEKPDGTNKKELEAWHKAHQEVVDLGGLFVIGTERHESRRIDNQLRGRSGRQGDPGASRFFISLEDYIIRVFGGDRTNFFKMLPLGDDEAIENSMLSNLIEQAQKRIEGQNYDVRKYVTDYDDVINKQRKVIYGRRQSVLLDKADFKWREELSKSVYNAIFDAVSKVQKGLKAKQYDLAIKELFTELKMINAYDLVDQAFLADLYKQKKYNHGKIAAELAKLYDDELDRRWAIYQEYIKSGMTRYVFLRAIDLLWTEHLVTIDQLNDSVRLRGYSQKDPLSEFKHEGMRIFRILIDEIDIEVARTTFKVTPELVPAGIMGKKY
jgi:preprotein translocase subunit SecA